MVQRVGWSGQGSRSADGADQLGALGGPQLQTSGNTLKGVPGQPDGCGGEGEIGGEGSHGWW